MRLAHYLPHSEFAEGHLVGIYHYLTRCDNLALSIDSELQNPLVSLDLVFVQNKLECAGRRCVREDTARKLHVLNFRWRIEVVTPTCSDQRGTHYRQKGTYESAHLRQSHL